MNKVFPILLLLLLLNFQQLSCQVTGADAHLFTIHDGLAQTFINTICQDSIGFLWIGTDEGLVKYDGYGFFSFRNLPFDTCSLPDNHIRAICEDPTGDLWIGTDEGLSRLDRKSGSFTNYLPLEGNSNSLSEATVYGLYADNSGTIWIKTGRYLVLILRYSLANLRLAFLRL